MYGPGHALTRAPGLGATLSGCTLPAYPAWVPPLREDGLLQGAGVLPGGVGEQRAWRALPSARPCSLPRQLGSDLHWRWVSSAALPCYGQMAVHAGKQVLPWVGTIASRMVCYFSCSSLVSPAGPRVAGRGAVCVHMPVLCVRVHECRARQPFQRPVCYA